MCYSNTKVHVPCTDSIMCLPPQVAIKSIRKERITDDLDRIHIQREIEITSSLRHPNIIRFHEGKSATHCTWTQVPKIIELMCSLRQLFIPWMLHETKVMHIHSQSLTVQISGAVKSKWVSYTFTISLIVKSVVQQFPQRIHWWTVWDTYEYVSN